MPSIEWPTFDPADTPIDKLVKLSRFYGSDPEFVIGGGGNTSVKIADRLFVTEHTVEKHVQNIFAKLHISATADDHRRVLAVLTFLNSD